MQHWWLEPHCNRPPSSRPSGAQALPGMYGARWRVQAMKFLQQAIRLRGYAQRDPLTEYKLEGFELFSGMMAQIRRNVIYNVYVFSPQKAKTSKEDKKQERKKKGIPAAV